ncbi:enolase C-terminal domain-like protein [Pseudomonas costantinii]|uniref:L-alanine-DL-glutamate epimerase n=1 Tax=Pseudomonas costantinii TaxID=168469 RepID=A0A1S2V4P2_9PSED|nr:enolase C-terminal domain-like protein [Pseudomonas costantinii]NVZ19466.1 L-alanine-DL-glutamate epimerase [Pseudomonas costantinii]OIN53684.1 L-alanine-DL-glutamate epimerase [Pseudomonas costantinii]SEE32547.1 L-alanine-DL-glutamate epimerase [Pseudomonas costantinii]
MTQPEVYLVRQPMANPFVHGAHRRQTSDSVVLSWTRDTFTGIGECAPRRYVTAEDCESVLTELRNIDFAHLAHALASGDPVDRGRALYEHGLPSLSEQDVGNNTRCLVEMAVLDTLAQQAGLPLSDYLLRITESAATASRTLPAQVNITQVLDLSQPVQAFLEQRKPLISLKLKLAGEPHANQQRLEAIRALAPNLALYVDPNMSWSPDQLHTSARKFRELDVALFEEPLPRGSLEDYRQARLEHGVAIMLDESVTSPASLEQAWQHQALDAVNLRIAKCGGLLTTTKMIEQCRRWGLPAYLGVQVAEVGPLIAAHRALLSMYDGFMGVEAGQHDHFFDSNMLEPMPAIDRLHNAIDLPVPTHPGLGCQLTSHVSTYRCAIDAGHLPNKPLHMERVQ